MEDTLLLKDKVARLLLRKGATRTELAQYCKASLPTVSRWLKGEQAITPRFIPLLAKFFGVDENYFWESMEEIPTPQQTSKPKPTKGMVLSIKGIEIDIQKNDASIKRLEQNYLVPSNVIKKTYTGNPDDLGVYVIPYSGLEPYLYLGDWVIVHLKDELPQDGRYVLATKHGIRFARLHYFVDGAIDVTEPVGDPYHLTVQQASELILKTFRIVLMIRLCD